MPTRAHTDEAIIKAVEQTMPAVVSVIASHELNKDNHGTGPTMQDGGGSGFLVEPYGTVLTNRHVLHNKDADFTVVLDNGDQLPATVLARDPINDIGILSIDLDDHPTIALGDSSDLHLGQTAIAIGNALGQFRNTVSVGVVSGLSRSVIAGFSPDDTQNTQNLRGLIQTDAAINPGNSGGPLVNLNGNAVGINAAVILGAQNISFAIPIQNAIRDLEDLKEYGRLKIPYVGVRYITITPDNQSKLGVSVDHGAMVLREHGPDNHAVAPDSPAADAGIQEGDIILSCGDTDITRDTTLLDIVQEYDVGDSVSCQLLRDGETTTVELKLTERT